MLVLLNAGQPQVDESGGAGSEPDSIGRCPNGDGGARNTNTYLARTPTPDAANNCPAPPVVARIHEVQGNGLVSPFAGAGVITSGIVTARKSNGFFMQDPLPDADPNTSEGIFVFVGVAPAVAVGDNVTVTGTATEFFYADTDFRFTGERFNLVERKSIAGPGCAYNNDSRSGWLANSTRAIRRHAHSCRHARLGRSDK